MSGGSGIGPGPGAIKQQTIGLLHAVAYLRGKISDMFALRCKHNEPFASFLLYPVY